MTETTNAVLASWLTHIWDQEETRERELPYIEFTSTLEQINYKGNPRLLARIAAERKILEVHGVAWNAEVCTVCHHLTGDDLHVDNDPWPCLTVRLLAKPYSDRPGYRDEWKP